MATAVIPWDDRYQLDETSFRNQIRNFLDRGVNHLYLFGTAGEGYAVTEKQYEQLIAIFAEEMRGPDCFPMVGQIHLSLPVMLERMDKAYDLGMRDFQFSLPSWGALSDRELHLFFRTVCESFSDCRFMHYNLPRAKRVLTPAQYFRLAEEFPNFVGAKFTSGDLSTIHTLAATPSPLQFFFGETGFVVGSMFGECGMLASLVNSNVARGLRVFEAGVTKDYEKLLAYSNDFQGMLKGLFAAAGTDNMDGAYDKVLYRMVDPAFPLRLLPPYSSCTEEESETYRTYLSDHYPHWLELQ